MLLVLNLFYSKSILQEKSVLQGKKKQAMDLRFILLFKIRRECHLSEAEMKESDQKENQGRRI